MLSNICLVKSQDERQSRLVKNATSIQHITHECSWIWGAWSINHISNHGRKGRRKGFSNYGSRSRPSKNFNLPRCVHQHIIKLVGSTFNNWNDLKVKMNSTTSLAWTQGKYTQNNSVLTLGTKIVQNLFRSCTNTKKRKYMKREVLALHQFIIFNFPCYYSISSKIRVKVRDLTIGI